MTAHNILVHVYLIGVNGREVSASGINTLAMWMLEHPESGAEPAPTKSREMNRRGSLESLDRRGLRYFTERCSTVHVELNIHVIFEVRSKHDFNMLGVHGEKLVLWHQVYEETKDFN